MDFDGQSETVHLERGARFGIPPEIYQCLAQASISASELAGIEPILIQPLIGRSGAMLTLYGRTYSFLIVVDPAAVQLSMCELDARKPFHRPVFIGDCSRHDDWAQVVSMMLDAEGFEAGSLDDLDAWNAQQGL